MKHWGKWVENMLLLIPLKNINKLQMTIDQIIKLGWGGQTDRNMYNLYEIHVEVGVPHLLANFLS